jgi:hypothetical protein
VRRATRWRHVVSRASARVIAGRIVVSRRASLDGPAPGRAEEEDVGDRTPAYHFASPVLLVMPMAPLLNRLVKRPHQYRALS